MNFRKFSKKIKNIDRTIKYCFKLGLLKKYENCPKLNCSGKVELRPDSCPDGKKWRCDNRLCGAKIGIRKGSIFEFSNKSIMDQMTMIYCFFNFNMNYKDYIHHCDFNSKTTVSKYLSLLREIVLDYNLKQDCMVGGPKKIVQIDETAIFRRKFNVGRIIPTQWIIGGVCPEDKTVFFCLVPNRNKETIKNVIREFVKEGSYIHTDEWAAYPSAISEAGVYEHSTVNHSKRFVSLDGTHTQNIENFWGKFKNFLRKRNYTNGNRDNLPQYMAEFIFKRKNKRPSMKKIARIIKSFDF